MYIYIYIYIYIHIHIYIYTYIHIYIYTSLLETLEALCGSASASSKFLDSHIKRTFVSDYVFNLKQKILSQSEIKVFEEG